MSTSNELAPCGHARSEAWDGCDYCASDFVDRRGGHPVGRYRLIGMNVGLAVDLRIEGRVTVAMLQADAVVSDSTGVWDAWMDGDGPFSESDATFRLIEPVHFLPPDTLPAEVAEVCEWASAVATAVRPMVESSIDGGSSPEEVVVAIGWWLDRERAGPVARRLVWTSVRLLILAQLSAEGHGGE